MSELRIPFYTSEGFIGYTYAIQREKDRRTSNPNQYSEHPIDPETKDKLEKELIKRAAYN